MPVQRLNHAVLYVRDVERSVAFYRDALDFRTLVQYPGATWACSRSARTRSPRRRGARPSASTTWRGRSTRWPNSSGSPNG
jgi:predicted enzyme related to lactoylglutathione lyase